MICPVCQRNETDAPDQCLSCLVQESWKLEKELESMLHKNQVNSFKFIQKERIKLRQQAFGSVKAPEESEFGERFIASLSPKQKKVFQKIRAGEQIFLCRVFGEPKCFVLDEKMAESP